MRIIYDCYELRATDENCYELVMWQDKKCSTTCIVLAFFEWDGEGDYDMRTVGTRFVKYYKEGLSEFVEKFCDFLAVMRELQERNAERE